MLKTVKKFNIDYCNKLILAPMVRGSKLPIRLLALRYGADLVYTDELIDFSLLSAKRQENDALGTIDYISDTNGYVSFRTCPAEKDRLIFQMGTSSPEKAVKLAKMVENDVSGLDINMGCPRKYSTSGGMGTALFGRPDRAKDILRALIQNVDLPVTCKIRILPDIDQTISIVKDFEAIGISAIAVHGRTKDERPHDPVNKEAIKRIAESVKIPVIANGGSTDMKSFEDIKKFQDECGTSSVMVARAAQENVSIFRQEGPLSLEELIPEYLKICVDVDNSVGNTKYSIQKMWPGFKKEAKWYRQFEDAQDLAEVCSYWNLEEYCRNKQSQHREKGYRSLRCSPITNCNQVTSDMFELRKQKFNDENIDFAKIVFHRKYYDMTTFPKTILHGHAGRNKMTLPVYQTQKADRLYYTVVTFEGKKYASLVWGRHKRYAEQAAALVCMLYTGMIEEEQLIENGSLFK